MLSRAFSIHECVRQLPADHVTAIPVNDGNQIHKPLRHRTVRDVSTPHLAGRDKTNTSQKVWTLMLPVPHAGAGLGATPCIPISLMSRCIHFLLTGWPLSLGHALSCGCRKTAHACTAHQSSASVAGSQYFT